MVKYAQYVVLYFFIGEWLLINNQMTQMFHINLEKHCGKFKVDINTAGKEKISWIQCKTLKLPFGADHNS